MSATEVAPDPVEVMDPAVRPVFYEIGPESLEDEPSEKRVYIQKELSFFGKIDFFATMAKAIEKAMREGVSIAELLETPETEAGKPLDLDSFAEADTFVKAIMQLVGYAPELLLDLYAVILAVPRKDREEAKEWFEEYITDEQGIKIIETFVEQNWEVMVSFFSERITPLVKTVGAKVRTSVPSKLSKPTRRNTRKASNS